MHRDTIEWRVGLGSCSMVLQATVPAVAPGKDKEPFHG
jgi:hypothetical protein